MLYGRRLVLDRREGAGALFYARLAGPFPTPAASSWLALAPVRAGPGASGPRSGPGASGLGLGLERGLGLGSWSLLPAWAWEPLLIGTTPHSCSTSPRRTGSC